ncbi:hypothetical protein LMG28140_04785 [Paraburkholderia metrosideri]|jgi:hypothetical protein|uniref:Uncharacterized protein n=1 Tax=Paraburkholderia metrosideri TaxID=580937 RepID=A0ABM8NYN8_9BURK|nr:hypothetical protein LMG28140_04785 [Paraburkholderia metrosideri]
MTAVPYAGAHAAWSGSARGCAGGGLISRINYLIVLCARCPQAWRLKFVDKESIRVMTRKAENSG